MSKTHNPQIRITTTVFRSSERRRFICFHSMSSITSVSLNSILINSLRALIIMDEKNSDFSINTTFLQIIKMLMRK